MTASIAPLNPAAGTSSIATGIGFAGLAFAMFTGMDTMIKWLSGGYPLVQIMFFNSVFALAAVTAFTLWQGGMWQVRTRRVGLHVARGIISTAGAFGGFFAFSRMPLADVYAIVFAAPLFITALSVPILKESVGWRRWLAVSVGFVGVLIMLRPGLGMISLGTLGGLAAALSYAISVLLIRRMGSTEHGASFGFWGSLTTVVITAALLPFGFIVPSLADLALFAACGATGGIAFRLVSEAYRRAPAAVIAPFQYSQMLWGVLLGFVIWSDVPPVRVAVGCAVVIASGLYILHRETVRSADRQSAAPATEAAAAPVNVTAT
ncbi:MAG: DMT family transporter [Inquilinaceae bacterium]